MTANEMCDSGAVAVVIDAEYDADVRDRDLPFHLETSLTDR